MHDGGVADMDGRAVAQEARPIQLRDEAIDVRHAGVVCAAEAQQAKDRPFDRDRRVNARELQYGFGNARSTFVTSVHLLRVEIELCHRSPVEWGGGARSIRVVDEAHRFVAQVFRVERMVVASRSLRLPRRARELIEKATRVRSGRERRS